MEKNKNRKQRKFKDFASEDNTDETEELVGDNINKGRKRKLEYKNKKEEKINLTDLTNPQDDKNKLSCLGNTNNIPQLILSPKNQSDVSENNLELNQSDLELIFEEDNKKFITDKDEGNTLRPKITNIYYINGNKLTLEDLKNGRRIFNNKTEFLGYSGFKENFIEFRQLLFKNLLLNEDFTENLKEKWTMESAIFSTFCYDAEFIEPLIKKFNLKSLIIKEGTNPGSKHIEEIDDNITFIHPKLDFTMKWGKFHSKLTIFKFPDFIRIIIPSANLTNGDWYYWGQIIWFQDFYMKNLERSNSNSEFEKYLEKVFESILPKGFKVSSWFQKLNIDISRYDFSDTPVDLVASASGRFSKENKIDFGVGRLKHLTDSYSKIRGSLKNSLNRLIIQCSSIGKSLREKFLSDFCESFMCRKKDEKYDMNIIYPTVDYVESFQLGRELSGCLFLNKETFLMHKYKFKRFEVVPELESYKTIFHSKFFISSDEKPIDPDTISDNIIFYFGSHNFSTAAWGNFERNDSQVSIANYELGIIFNPIKLRYEEKQNIVRSLLINLNSGFYSNLDEAWIFDDI